MVVSAHSATRRKSTGFERVTLSYADTVSASKSNPYWAGFFAITIAARIIGTYSRVSRGSSLALADNFQKSSIPPARLMALCNRPGPPL